jgi:hypothetical protein
VTKAIIAAKVYEYGHRDAPFTNARQALEAATDDALAACQLGLNIVIEPITRQSYRGGNIQSYRLSFPVEAINIDDD